MEPTQFDLTPEQKGLLHSLSRKTGKPVYALIHEALEGLKGHVRPEDADSGRKGGDQENHAASSPHKPIWEHFEEASREIPDEELDCLPTDGSLQHDHYIYGMPKRQT